MTIPYHLRIFHRRFQSNTFDENLIKNLDEIHFIINIHSGCSIEILPSNMSMLLLGDAVTMIVCILGPIDLV